MTNASAWCTPSQSITPEVREAFDRMGGAIARAFYMASNYILAFEILQHHLSTGNENHVYVVDRWYASTCAYSIAWKNAFGTSSSPQEYIRLLDNVVFQWPHDLMAPQLLLLLDVDHEIRKERVQTRNISNNHNPWDERLNQDEHLGRRIMSCMKRVNGPLEQVILNANQTQQEVLKEALDIVMNRVKQQQQQQHMTTTACHPANDSLLFFFRANLTKSQSLWYSREHILQEKQHWVKE
jgi:thymidylate kinase